LYTPVFKRVTMVKNALVASIIALAPISGALAAGAVSHVIALGSTARKPLSTCCFFQ
jgi:4-hydroxybenzoate polyprenyltransferase